MKILVDADSCPVKDIIVKVSKEFNIEALFISSISHLIDAPNVLVVDNYSQSVDIEIINRVNNNDIVITNDYGLASLVISKAKCISNNGYIYTNDKMDDLLLRRHLTMKMKNRKDFKIKGPKKRTNEDNKKFEQNLIKLIKNDF